MQKSYVLGAALLAAASSNPSHADDRQDFAECFWETANELDATEAYSKALVDADSLDSVDIYSKIIPLSLVVYPKCLGVDVTAVKAGENEEYAWIEPLLTATIPIDDDERDSTLALSEVPEVKETGQTAWEVHEQSEENSIYTRTMNRETKTIFGTMCAENQPAQFLLYRLTEKNETWGNGIYAKVKVDGQETHTFFSDAYGPMKAMVASIANEDSEDWKEFVGQIKGGDVAKVQIKWSSGSTRSDYSLAGANEVLTQWENMCRDRGYFFD